MISPLMRVAQAVRDIEDAVEHPPAVAMLVAIHMNYRTEPTDLPLETRGASNARKVKSSFSLVPCKVPILLLIAEHEVLSWQEVAEGYDRCIVAPSAVRLIHI
jgi:hypothetical protein